MLVSHHEQLWPGPNSPQESGPSLEFLAELLRGEHRRIDLAAQPPFSIAKRRNDVGQPHIANHQQVDVARRRLLGTRDGPKDQGDVNAAVAHQWRETRAEDVRRSSCLLDNRAQLGENGRLAVRREVHMIPAHLARDETGFGQLAELALNGTRPAADCTEYFAEVEPLAWPA